MRHYDMPQSLPGTVAALVTVPGNPLCANLGCDQVESVVPMDGVVMAEMLTNEDVRAELEALWAEAAPKVCPQDQCDAMWAWLCSGDYFEAPASSRHHGCMPGGLARHTLHVAREAQKLAATYGESHPNEPSVAAEAIVAAILHDICKVGLYRVNDGSDPEHPIEERPYLYDRERVRRHGTLSRAITYKHMPAAPAGVLDAIEWHMGFYDRRLTMKPLDKLPASQLVSTLEGIERNRSRYEAARDRSPVVDVVHMADTIAARLVEDWS